jgi:hypothetical protein
MVNKKDLNPETRNLPHLDLLSPILYLPFVSRFANFTTLPSYRTFIYSNRLAPDCYKVTQQCQEWLLQDANRYNHAEVTQQCQEWLLQDANRYNHASHEVTQHKGRLLTGEKQPTYPAAPQPVYRSNALFTFLPRIHPSFNHLSQNPRVKSFTNAPRRITFLSASNIQAQRSSTAEDMATTSTNSWEPSTTIELLALLLTIPSSMVAIAALWAMRQRRQQSEISTSLNSCCSHVLHTNKR